MKLLKRLTLPILALLSVSLLGGCGKPLDAGEGDASGQPGRDNRALGAEKARRDEADKLLQDGFVKVGQALSMAHFAVQAKLPGNAGFQSIPLAVEPPAPVGADPADAAVPADSSAPVDAAAPADEAASPDPAAPADAAAPADDNAAADAAAPADAEAPAEGSAPVTAADEGLVEAQGPQMPALIAQGTVANDMLSQAYALLEDARTTVAPLLNGEYDSVLDDASRDKVISLQELLSVSENLIYTGSYLLPINQDVVELIKQAREAAEIPAADAADAAAPVDAAEAAAPADAADASPAADAPAPVDAADAAAPADASPAADAAAPADASPAADAPAPADAEVPEGSPAP